MCEIKEFSPGELSINAGINSEANSSFLEE